MLIDELPLVIQSAFKRRLPPKTDYGIAFIGCGGIINYGHIPAYQASGFNLLGGYDRNPEAAEKTVETHGLKKLYGSLEELLADPQVEIVDIAVIPGQQRDIVEKAAAAGKHILCQKPFSVHYPEAV